VHTKADLFREYARVIDMCEGTKVKPCACVKVNGFALASEPPSEPQCYFDEMYSNLFEFALAIVENRPVFKGDYIYLGIGLNGDKYSVNKAFFETYKGHKFSWNPPKPKTVMVEMLREDAIKIADFFNISNCTSIWDRASVACKKALGQ